MPFLEEAESFLGYWISDLELVDNCGLRELASKFVIWRAWSRAVNSLDLVLTPNGFAVVSNQTLAPASKDRVAAAQRNAVAQADATACLLIAQLWKHAGWRNSKCASRYRTIFLNLRVIPQFLKLDKPELPFYFFINNQGNFSKYERFIALHYISPDVLGLLHDDAATLAFGNPDDVCECDRLILDAVRAAVALMFDEPLNNVEFRTQCYEIVRLLDNSDGCYSVAWKNSIQFKAFKSNSFTNEKESGGYFF